MLFKYSVDLAFFCWLKAQNVLFWLNFNRKNANSIYLKKIIAVNFFIFFFYINVQDFEKISL